MSTPQLGVIIPVYNGAKTLDRTLASVACQADARIEVIAVDQASTDGSRQILVGYAGRMALRVIDAPDSTCWMQNTNIGLAAARAPLVTMLHQDDIWLPGRVDALLALAARYGDAALWIHPAWFIDDADRKIGRFGPAFGPAERLIDSDEVLRSLMVQNSVALPASMFRRQAALDLGGLAEDLWYTADWDLWLKLARSGPVAWSPEKLAAFRIHAGSQTVTGSKDLTDFAEQLNIPVERHIGALAAGDIPRVRAMAQASNALNLYLVSVFHRDRQPVWPVIARILRLGPFAWSAFLRRTQIIARMRPRLRLARTRKGNLS